ncbi:MAG TPA: tripartite tricarboxylate transporter substrate-binding protein, partial [Burkholderiales bacterium]|nr:tripartite tricarboxylate transporter substrate-binding protein [Burkholderiales bacterium]
MRRAILMFLPAVLCAASVYAQPYPAKPIRIIVGTSAGGGVDTISRILGQKLPEQLGQQVVVENRPGAGGAVGSELVAKSPRDGYTLLTISIAYAVIPSSHRNLPYDPVNDLAPVAVLVNAPNLLAVHPSLPVRSVRELVQLARAKPDELTYASSGNGSPAHLASELLNLLAGIKLVHVPYKGTSAGMVDLVAGRVSIMVGSVLSTMPHARAGKVRVLATTGGRRAEAVPELPTIAEAGVKGYAVDVWYALFVPTGTA